MVKIWRERDAASVSLRMYVVTVTGFSLWTVYGAMLGSWPLIGSNLVSLGFSAAILALKLKFGGRTEKGRGSLRGPSSMDRRLAACSTCRTRPGGVVIRKRMTSSIFSSM